jgi:hypothetical protein
MFSNKFQSMQDLYGIQLLGSTLKYFTKRLRRAVAEAQKCIENTHVRTAILLPNRLNLKEHPLCFSKMGGMGAWRCGNTLASHHCGPMGRGFSPRLGYFMWVELVVGSLPCHEGFSPGSPVFLRKNQHSKFQFDRTRAMELSVFLLPSNVTLVK